MAFLLATDLGIVVVRLAGAKEIAKRNRKPTPGQAALCVTIAGLGAIQPTISPHSLIGIYISLATFLDIGVSSVRIDIFKVFLGLPCLALLIYVVDGGTIILNNILFLLLDVGVWSVGVVVFEVLQCHVGRRRHSIDQYILTFSNAWEWRAYQQLEH